MIIFEKEFYESQFLEIAVEVVAHDFEIVIQALPELVQNEEYFITATILYLSNNTNQNNSLGLSQLVDQYN